MKQATFRRVSKRLALEKRLTCRARDREWLEKRKCLKQNWAGATCKFCERSVTHRPFRSLWSRNVCTQLNIQAILSATVYASMFVSCLVIVYIFGRQRSRQTRADQSCRQCAESQLSLVHNTEAEHPHTRVVEKFARKQCCSAISNHCRALQTNGTRRVAPCSCFWLRVLPLAAEETFYRIFSLVAICALSVTFCLH